MRCLDCSNLVSRNAAMTRHGFVGCKNTPEWKYRVMTSDIECAQFAQVTPEVAKTREAWAAKVGAA